MMTIVIKFDLAKTLSIFSDVLILISYFVWVLTYTIHTFARVFVAKISLIKLDQKEYFTISFESNSKKLCSNKTKVDTINIKDNGRLLIK